MTDNVHPLRHGAGGDDWRGLRPMPHSIEAEQALLGAVLANNRAYDDALDLRARDFFHTHHAVLWDIIAREIDEGRHVDVITLRTLVDASPALAGMGGVQYLADLAASAITLVNVPDYVRTIASLARARRLCLIGDQLAIRSDGSDNAAVEQWLDSELSALGGAGAGRGFRPLTEGLHEAMEVADRAFRAGDAVTGLPSGLTDLDAVLGGFHPGNMVVLAGRPGMGKSAIAFAIAANVAGHMPLATPDGGVRGKTVAIFSLEMSASEIAMRLVAAKGKIEATAIRKGRADFEHVFLTSRGLETSIGSGIMIDETPAPNIGAVRAAARRLARRGPIDLVIIDHMQLIAGSDARRRGNRTEDMTEISASCKALAKDLNCPVIALSQLNRSVEAREDKRPQLADLRESGSIEQDADVVLFAFRKSYYLDRSEPVRLDRESHEQFDARHLRWMESMKYHHGRCALIVAKNRHGPAGSSVFVRFDLATQAVEDLPPGGPPPPAGD